MFISRFQIKNYKSFLDTKWVNLTQGFNIVAGKNDVGKSALMEALSLQFSNHPHRSLETIPYKGANFGDQSKVEVEFKLSKDELRLLLTDHVKDIYVPISPDPNIPYDMKQVLESFQSVVDSSESNLKVIFNHGEVAEAYFTGYAHSSDSTLYLKINRDRLSIKETGKHHIARSGSVAWKIADILRNRVYMFRAQRFNIGEHRYGHTRKLVPDASNLPEVLGALQGTNPVLFRQLNKYVEEIFPHIKQITLVPTEGQNVQIRLWTLKPDLARDDLAIPLHQSGTGISQVLAMLYVVLTSDYPQVILIDEPQSFLHPGAVRKLLDVLKDYKQHQYIITTHSPIAITTLEPETIQFVRKQEAQSLIESIDVHETQTLRSYLAEIGARLSDVYGADNILWVEGATEERCFPLIVEKIAQLRLRGTSILGVKNTGDLKGKHQRLVVDIYKRLSGSQSLLPPAIGFIFDREGLTEQACQDLKRESEGSIFFLQRKMYENYLLNPTAIAALMSSIEGFPSVSVTEIAEWLKNQQQNRQNSGTENQSNVTWLENVDGAKLLKDLFKHFSEGLFEYDHKPEYGRVLTEWLINNQPDELLEIADLLKNVLMRTSAQ
jgi:AAA15 family ATPase/GTPase